MPGFELLFLPQVVIETISHGNIDSVKSEGVVNFHQDQGLPIGFKGGYLFAV
jgi:hypothetical protein